MQISADRGLGCMRLSTDRDRRDTRYRGAPRARRFHCFVRHRSRPDLCASVRRAVGMLRGVARALSPGRPDAFVMAKRAFEAMMTMKKIHITTIEAARRG